MTKLIRNVRTTAGKKLLNSAISGNSKLIYTTAELYTKDVSGLTDDQLAGTSDLGTSLLSGKINITDYNDTTITASAEFLNSSLTNDIAFKTIGWYATTALDKAQGKPPVLFVISQLDNETTMVSGNNERTTSFFLPRIIMRISNAESVVLETGEVGFVTLPELEGKIAELANKGLIDFGQKFNSDYDLKNLHNTSLHYVDKGSVIGLPETSENEPKDLGGYLISLGKGDTTQDGVRIYFNPFSNKTFVSYYLNKTNTWTDWLEVGSKSYSKDEINQILADYATKASLTQLLAGKANVDDLAKFVKSVEGFKPDKEGSVVFLTNTYQNQAIEPNTFTKTGVYKLVNCTYKFVGISSIGTNDALNGYLIVTKGKTDNDLFQYLITDINDNAKINFRKISPSRSIYPEFKKLLDNKDVHRFSDPDKYYASSDTVDIDQLTEAGIYHFMDAHVVATIRKDALDGLPRTGNGTQMCGYLIVLRHDDFNREQILILNSGVEIPDFAIAVRSVSGTNSYRPRFRKVLKIEDASLDGREHTFNRKSHFDPDVDENASSPIMPTDITSTTPDSNRVNLDNLINTYQESSRVISDFVSESLPKFYVSRFTINITGNDKVTTRAEGFFNNHTQRIRYLVKPVIYSNKYDTYQRVKSGGCVFERYHTKSYANDDPLHGWLRWNFVENYGTGLGDRSVYGLIDVDRGADSYSTIGVDYPPVLPGFAPLYYLNGFYNEDAVNCWFPPGTYVRRISDKLSANIDEPPSSGLTSYNSILQVKSVPFIFTHPNLASGFTRMTAHFVQTIYAISPSMFVDDEKGGSDIFQRQGYIGIPILDSETDFSLYTQKTGKWYTIGRTFS